MSSLDELDHFGRLVVQMRLVIIVNADFALRVLQPTNVHPSGSCELPYKLRQVRQVVRQIMRFIKLLEEIGLFLLFCLVLHLHGFLFPDVDLLSLGVAHLFLSHSFKFLRPLNNSK